MKITTTGYIEDYRKKRVFDRELNNKIIEVFALVREIEIASINGLKVFPAHSPTIRNVVEATQVLSKEIYETVKSEASFVNAAITKFVEGKDSSEMNKVEELKTKIAGYKLRADGLFISLRRSRLPEPEEVGT